MFYVIYKITNQIDGKFYIGSHKTKDLNDNYMGSGKYLKRAIEKYGIENFTKEILFVFDTPEQMCAKEAEIVNEDFLVVENTYNLKKGGFGGWDYLNQDKELHSTRSAEAAKKMHELHPEVKHKWNLARLTSYRNKLLTNGGAWWEPSNGFRGKEHSSETKKMMSESQIGKHTGEKNSQYGTRWVYSMSLRQSKKIAKDEPIPEGWVEGRKMKFTDIE
jgi:group I intron endonuclease